LQVINSSPGDLAPVFDAILEKAHSLCEADFGTMFTHDGDRFWPIAAHGASARVVPAFTDGIRPSSNSAFAQLVGGDRFVQIPDMVEFAEQRADDPLTPFVEIAGIRTQLMVPMRKDGKLLGAITANRCEVRPFSDKQIALLQNFAAPNGKGPDKPSLGAQRRRQLGSGPTQSKQGKPSGVAGINRRP